MLGAISEFDKAMTVAKMRGARAHNRREAGKCEGRKEPCRAGGAGQTSTSAEAEGWTHVAACDFGRAGNQRLFLNENGRPFAAASVKSMLD